MSDKNYGWICPVCGRGNNPKVDSCPCNQAPVHPIYPVLPTPYYVYPDHWPPYPPYPQVIYGAGTAC